MGKGHFIAITDLWHFYTEEKDISKRILKVSQNQADKAKKGILFIESCHV